VTFSQPTQAAFGIANCPVTVIVSDPYNATWQVTWSSKSGLSGANVGSTTDKWCVIPNSPGVINFQASVTNNPNNYICWMNPGSTQVNYTGAPVGAVFNVECLPAFVYVNVLNDTFNAGWEVEDWETSISGSSNVYNAILPVDVQPNPFGSGYIVWDEVWASITSNPNGYTCTINPSYMSLDGNYFGAKLNFTVSCSVAPISVNVYYSGLSAWYPPGWVITWSGAANGSANSNEYPPNIVPGVGVESSFTIYPSRNGTVYFTANITSMPSIFKSCAISPATTTAIPGQTVAFTINCVPKYIAYVTVDSCPGPLWYVASSVDEIMGMTSVTNETIALGGYVDTLSAGIVWGASGITPSSIQVTNGSYVTFTVNCGGGNNGGNNNYFVYVTVTNDTLNAGWQIKSSVSSISGSGDVTNQTLKIGGQTDTLTASVTSPSGYACSISPGSTQATNGSTYTFTINCVQSQTPQTTYGCILTVGGQGSPSGAPAPSVNPSGKVFVPSGQTQGIGATAPLSSGGSSNWYEFDYWSDSFSGSGKLNETSSWTRGGKAYSTWQYACPSGLTSNVTATATIIANYVWDYITLSGPTSVSPPSSGSEAVIQYTLTWNVDPGSADQVSWSVSQLSGTQFKVSASLTYTEYGASSKGGSYITTTVTCNTGEVYGLQVSGSSPSTYSVSGASGSTTWTVYATWECLVNRGNGQQ
jgi:hypothetical protein